MGQFPQKAKNIPLPRHHQVYSPLPQTLELPFLFESTNISSVTSNFVVSPTGFANQEHYPFQTLDISSTC